MHLINAKPDVELPTPLGEWVLVRKEKKDAGGLILPDSADAAYHYYAQDVGPEANYVQAGDRLELHPRRSLANAVMINDEYALVPADCFVGVYR